MAEQKREIYAVKLVIGHGVYGSVYHTDPERAQKHAAAERARGIHVKTRTYRYCETKGCTNKAHDCKVCKPCWRKRYAQMNRGPIAK